MTATLFRQWVAEHPDITIVDWGVPQKFNGEVYEPVMRKTSRDS